MVVVAVQGAPRKLIDPPTHNRADIKRRSEYLVPCYPCGPRRMSIALTVCAFHIVQKDSKEHLRV